jgi:flagellar hook-associated protein FlgK
MVLGLKMVVMNINTALNGLNAASSRFESKANTVLRATTPSDSAALSDQDMAEALVGMQIDKNAFKANAKVLKAQDDMLGSLLDILA